MELETRGRNGGPGTWKEMGPRRGKKNPAREWSREDGKPQTCSSPALLQPHVSSPQPPRPGASSRTCCSLRAGSRLRPHQEAPRSYKFRLPSSQAASAATCAAAHSQGQQERAGAGASGSARAAPPWCAAQLVAERLEPGGRELRGGRAADPDGPALQAHTAGAACGAGGIGHMTARPASRVRSPLASSPLAPRLPPPRSSRRLPWTPSFSLCCAFVVLTALIN